MNQSLLLPIIDTAQAAARALIGALDVLKAHLAPPTECQHANKDTSLGTMGWERWTCKDCGLKYEKDLNSSTN